MPMDVVRSCTTTSWACAPLHHGPMVPCSVRFVVHVWWPPAMTHEALWHYGDGGGAGACFFPACCIAAMHVPHVLPARRMHALHACLCAVCTRMQARHQHGRGPCCGRAQAAHKDDQHNRGDCAGEGSIMALGVVTVIEVIVHERCVRVWGGRASGWVGLGHGKPRGCGGAPGG